MKIIPEPLIFEWDSGNQEKNWLKHRITTKEIEKVFVNKPAFIFADEKHSFSEKRYGLYGRTDGGRLISIVFMIRQQTIRVITARDMSKKERRIYEKTKANTKI